MHATAIAATTTEVRYSLAELNRALDRDRIHGFMTFVRSMPPTDNGVMMGTTDQARSIARALEQLGY